jgi:hypothetical protein
MWKLLLYSRNRAGSVQPSERSFDRFGGQAMNYLNRSVQVVRSGIIFGAILCVGCGNSGDAEQQSQGERAHYWDGPEATICTEMSGQAYCFPRSAVISTGSPGERTGIYLRVADDSIVLGDCNKSRLEGMGGHEYAIRMNVSELYPQDTMEELYDRILRGRFSWFDIDFSLANMFHDCSPIQQKFGVDMICAGTMDGVLNKSGIISYFVECNAANYVPNPSCKATIVVDNLEIKMSPSRECLPHMMDIIRNTQGYVISRKLKGLD